MIDIWWLKLLIPIFISIPFLTNIIKLDSKLPTSQCLGVLIITVSWWILETYHVVITAFLPISLFPILGVSTAKTMASLMFNDITLVVFGGFIISIAMIKWNLHSRIALKIVMMIGLKPKLLLLGFSIATTFLSMWISNAAASLTMIPNALAVVKKLEDLSTNPSQIKPFAKALFLSIATSTSIGGMATLVGAPSNLVLAKTLSDYFPNEKKITFGNYFLYSFPLIIILFLLMYISFLLFYSKEMNLPQINNDLLKEQYDSLGPMKYEEKIILSLFSTLAILWLFRGDLQFGESLKIKGWTSLLYPVSKNSYVQDGTIALLLPLLLFLIFTKKESKKNSSIELNLLTEDNIEISNEVESQPILEWKETTKEIPWDILFLMSGGFALSQGISESGLDKIIAKNLNHLINLPTFFMLFIVTFIISWISSFMSNTAIATIVLPILCQVIINSSKKISPFLLTIPSAWAVSFGFYIPIATPGNMIAMGTGYLSTKDFLTIGSLVNIIGIFIIVTYSIVIFS